MKKLTLLFIGILSFTFCKSQSFEWAKSFGGPAAEDISSVALDNGGNAYVTGRFSGTIDFDPGPAVVNVTSAGGNDIFISKFDPSGNLLWVKRIGGTGDDGNEAAGLSREQQGTSLCIDALGNLYKTGYISGTVDMDPGPGVTNFTSSGVRDCFVMKMDSSGNFIWATQFGNVSEDRGDIIGLDGSNNLIVKGFFSYTVDFDPGPAVFNLTGPCNFMLKLDTSGNFLWARKMGSSTSWGPNAIALAVNSSGSFYTTGGFVGTLDFDPVGTYYVTAVGSAENVFVSKYNSSGNFVWTETWGSASVNCQPRAIIANTNKDIFVTGSFGESIDFDPGPGSTVLTATGNKDAFIMKLDSTGGFKWVKQIKGNCFPDCGAFPESISMDATGNLYIVGLLFGTIDADPGIGVYNLSTPLYAGDIFLLKLDPNGNFIWARSFGGADNDNSCSVQVSNGGDIYFTGIYRDTADFNPAATVFNLISNAGDDDFYLCKLSQDTCSNISLSIDSVSTINCTADGYISSHSLNAIAPYSYAWNTSLPVYDSVISCTLPGIYQLTITDYLGCSHTTSVLINGPDSISGFDLQGDLLSTGLRPGRLGHVWVSAFNHLCAPTSGNVRLILDSALTYISSIPAPDYILGDTLIWNFANITYDSLLTGYDITVIPYAGLSSGYIACNSLTINPLAGDIDTVNNVRQYCSTVLTSYDPNIKSVYPTGSCIPGYVENDQLLTYTIQFQNTGSADAIDVYVLDTLDADLDVNTVRVTGNSDPLITEILPGNVLKFRFDNIHLPDSTSNEPGSHGYVIYEVMPVAGLSNATQIRNKAGIYFDFNPPVYTNEVLNTISDGTFDLSTSTSGITITANLSTGSYQWIDCSNGDSIAGATAQDFTPIQNGNYAVIISDGCVTDTSDCVAVLSLGINSKDHYNEFSIYPNPANSEITVKSDKPTEIRIINMLGEVLMIKTIGKEAVVDISQLANGIYFIQTTEGTMQKLVRQ